MAKGTSCGFRQVHGRKVGIIPIPDKGKQKDYDDGGGGYRKHDPEEHPEDAGAFQAAASSSSFGSVEKNWR